jgi:CTP-dependent riboflavin kinase
MRLARSLFDSVSIQRLREEVKARHKIDGIIFSDLGEAGRFMALEWVQEALRRQLGFAPFPATLNLRPKGRPDAGAWQTVQTELKRIDLFPAESGFCAAKLFLVDINTPAANGPLIRGAVLLPEVANYPKDKIEVVAPMRLKDQFGVRDGDQLTLEFVN